MMRTLLIIFCLVAGLYGCMKEWTTSQPNQTFDVPSTWYICLDLPKEHLSDAIDATLLWDRSLHQWKHIQPVTGLSGPACRVRVFEVDAYPIDDSEQTALAWTSMIGGQEIMMKKGRYEQDVKGVLLHELGHAFGAQHVPGTLMNPGLVHSTPRCPDATTVAQVAAWNNVNLELLTWCW